MTRGHENFKFNKFKIEPDKCHIVRKQENRVLWITASEDHAKHIAYN